MIGVLQKIQESNGVILEPIQETGFPLWIGGLMLGIVLIGLISTIIAEDIMPFFMSILIGISTIIVSFLYVSNGENHEQYEESSKILQEKYGDIVTPEQVKESRLLTSIGKDTVEVIPYYSGALRESETGEWMRENRSFMVDGKVVEILVEFVPVENELEGKDAKSSS